MEITVFFQISFLLFVTYPETFGALPHYPEGYLLPSFSWVYVTHNLVPTTHDPRPTTHDPRPTTHDY